MLFAGSIARQQWRARIETIDGAPESLTKNASPASNGGRGLKRVLFLSVLFLCTASPASNGGRGLKRERAEASRYQAASPASNGGRGLKHDGAKALHHGQDASPASNGGRGLKLQLRHRMRRDAVRIARQQWRARIETNSGGGYGAKF